MKEDLGLVHIYCGDGKGKTTAAVGLTIRALGSGLQVLFVQFLKNQPTGELTILQAMPGIDIIRGKAGQGFSFQMTEIERQKTIDQHNQNLQTAIQAVQTGRYHLLILDEIIGAYRKALLDQKLVLDFLQNKPKQLEVVLTGREPTQELLALADYISEIKKIKHPYDAGIKARIGIER